MSAKNIKRYSRKFLNPITHWDTGILEWNVEQTDNSIRAGLAMWDCSRKITLDFDCYDTNDMKLRAKKIDILINELIEFKEAMADAASNCVIHFDEDD